MALTTLTTGMSVAEHITALNDNMTFLAKHGQPVVYYADMPQWEIESAHKINGLGDFDSLHFGGTDYLDYLNAAFVTLNATDTTSVVGATDVKTVGAIGDGATDDAAAINAALVTGNILIQDGTFRIEESIKIPSNRTVYLYNCKVVSKSGVYDNIFVNADINTGNVNINIIGLGNAEVNGNAKFCDDKYATYGLNVKGTVPPYNNESYRYIGIFLCQVVGFEISNLFLADIPHWYLGFQDAQDGSSHDLYHRRYRITANQGYVTVMYDSNTLDFYNIAGDCRDDYFAFSVGNYASFSNSAIVGFQHGNIYDCNIWNVHMKDTFSDAFGSLLTVIPGETRKIYDINVSDCWIEAGTLFYNSFDNYVDAIPAKTDCYNITVDNCETTGSVPSNRRAVFHFGMDLMNTAFTNIKHPLASLRIIKDVATVDYSDNVKINGDQI